MRNSRPTALGRRLLLLVVAAALAGAPAGAQPTAVPDRSPADCIDHVLPTGALAGRGGVDLQDATVMDLQAAMATGRLSSAALTAAYLERIDAYDGVLNSVRALNPDALADAAARDAERAAGVVRGPLHGIPVLLKDNVGTDDLPTTAGSVALEGTVPDEDATLTRALREAGAVILGKANLSEFANWVSLSMPNGYSSLGGQVVAPYDFAQDPSGSSTGSGVAGTMALAAVTIGTETSGSIISPATAHSLVGFKPTRGMVSRAGIIPLAPSFDTAGPMVRSVVDAAAVLDAVAVEDPADPVTLERPDGVGPGAFLAALDDTDLTGVRLGVRAGDLEDDGLLGDALAVLEGLGAELVAVDEEVALTTNASLTSLPAIFNDFKLSLNAYLQTVDPPTGVRSLADVIAFNETRPEEVRYGQDLLQLSDAQTGLAADPLYLAARTAAQQGSQLSLQAAFALYGIDALVGGGSANTGVTAAGGHPNLTVPMGYSGVRPQGLAIAGPRWADAEVLRIGHAYQQAADVRVPATELNPDLVALAC